MSTRFSFLPFAGGAYRNFRVHPNGYISDADSVTAQNGSENGSVDGSVDDSVAAQNGGSSEGVLTRLNSTIAPILWPIEFDPTSEDDWRIVSSDDAASPTRESKIQKTENSSAFNPIKPKEEEELLPYSEVSAGQDAHTSVLTSAVPALFHKELPPCGAEAQIAYLRVVGLLRERWLAKRGRIDIIELCKAVKEELDEEADRGPTFVDSRGKRVRKPWRRESVFEYEIRWANYFYREAKATNVKHVHNVDGTGAPTEVDVALNLVPHELKFDLKTNPEVLLMWIGWNKHRYVLKPQLPPPSPVFMDIKMGAMDDPDMVELDDDTEVSTAVLGMMPNGVVPNMDHHHVQPDTRKANKNESSDHHCWSCHGHD